MRLPLLPIFTICTFLISSCTEQNSETSVERFSDVPDIGISPEYVRTYDDLQLFLEQQYGDVEELPFAAMIASGMPTRVLFHYRLPDGREIEIPIIFIGLGERIVDPEFDLYSLPN